MVFLAIVAVAVVAFFVWPRRSPCEHPNAYHIGPNDLGDYSQVYGCPDCRATIHRPY